MKVSVCIPVYNAEPYLERCARSLLSQRGVDIECVFVDDGSTDDSVGVLNRVIGESDAQGVRSSVVRLALNVGRVGARLAALREVTGDYVGFCDADDWVEPECYAKLLAAAEEGDCDAAICQYVDVAADGSKSPPRAVRGFCADPSGFVAQGFYSPGFNSLCNKIFRTSIARRWLEDEMPDISVGEDLLMTMRFLSRAKRLASVDEALYDYRKTASSVSLQINRRTVTDMVSCIRVLAEEFTSLPKPALDVMRIHALWAACRCRDITDGEVEDIRKEFAIDFGMVANVPSVKRWVLSHVSGVSPLRGAVRLIEWGRSVAT